MMTRKKKVTVAAVTLFGGVVAAGLVAFSPKPHALKIHVETIRDEDGHYFRRWTFTGGRWASYSEGFSSSDHVVDLERLGVRDSASIRFIKEGLPVGANQLVYEVEAHRVPLAEANGHRLVSVRRTLTGNSMGGTPSFSKTILSPMRDAPWAARFRTTQAEDADVTFPTKLKLGDFGGSAEVIEFR